jgi:maltokinase
MTVDDALLTAALALWLPDRRWFADKGRRIDRVAVHRLRELPVAGAAGVLAIVTVAFRDGSERRYQVPLGWRCDPCYRPADELIGVFDGVAVYDATADPALMTALLRELARGHIGTTYGPRLRAALAQADPPARRMTAEQSNTSVVFADEFVLKLFRTPVVGVNPELEVQLALRGNPHIAELVASIETAAEPETLGVIQEFLPDAIDGWQMVTAAFTGRDATVDTRLHALGAAVARVHAGLASALGIQPLTQSWAGAIRAGMVGRLAAVAREVPEIAAHEDALRVVFDAVGQETTGAVQRVHGDLHLGQVLWSAGRWVLIDFEGRPASPLESRRAPQSPLRDVAGMLRSIEYAAAEAGQVTAGRVASARAAFLAGYAEVSGIDPDMPMTSAYELDTALYEVGYELRNRPDRIGIPLEAVRGFAAGLRRDR